MRNSGEPTVEEILDSIKQVIARDNRAEAAQARLRRETEGVSNIETDVADEQVEDVLDLAESGECLDGEKAEEQVEPALVAEQTTMSMRESLAALAMLSEPGAQPQIVRSGETSLEGLVRELLRPALSEWLDKNLPPLVERMVAEEIRRISGKKG